MRIEGRKSQDGQAYEVWQGGTLLKAVPIEAARDDAKLLAAIKRNRWGDL